MKVCENCGKSNLPTRKFCIRCGRSLISVKSRKAAKTEPAPDIPELGRTITGASIAAAQEPPPPVDEEEEWVKPSEVPKDRVRSTRPKRMTELEKAREAFKRAEEVGIDEADSGIVEARMLRASEVRELMEGVTEMGASEPVPSDASADAPVPPPIAAPKPEEIEEQILGSMSAYVDKSEPAPVEEPFAEDFTSSKYTQPPSKPQEETSAEPTAPSTEPSEPIAMQEEAVTTCPHCGEVINIDSFEYPKEVYSAMGAARVKQARFFVVQGKYAEAQKVVRIARSLYLKADDSAGLTEVNKLVDSLARRG